MWEDEEVDCGEEEVKRRNVRTGSEYRWSTQEDDNGLWDFLGLLYMYIRLYCLAQGLK